jgi:hypothetical protein
MLDRTKVIPKEDLIDNAFYIGEGRFCGNPQVAMWNESRQQFVGFGYSFGHYETDYAVYGERGFDPIRKVE